MGPFVGVGPHRKVYTTRLPPVVHQSRESTRPSAWGLAPAAVEGEPPGYVEELLLGGAFDQAVSETAAGGEIVQLCRRAPPARVLGLPKRRDGKVTLSGGVVAAAKKRCLRAGSGRSGPPSRQAATDAKETLGANLVSGSVC